jgi:hypothetical protein
MDKNNNGVEDKKEAYVSYGIAGIGLIMSLFAFFYFHEFDLSMKFFGASVMLSGVRDGVDGLKSYLK